MKNSGEAKLFLGILVVAVILVGLALRPTLFPPKDHVEKPPPPPPELAREDLLPPGTRIRGDANAPYILYEFGDYQCPRCQTAAFDVEKYLKKYAKKLRYVFNYTSVVDRAQHPHAEMLAMASEAADDQQKFWEMHEALFQAQYKFNNASQEQVLAELTQIATRLKLDVASFKSVMASDAVGKALDRQKAVGVKAKVMQTPWFYVLPPKGDPILLKSLDDASKWLDNPANLK